MEKFAIFTDSSCNLTSEEAKKYGVYGILPMHFYIGEKEYDANGDWNDMGAAEYYDIIRNGTRIRSSQIRSTEYEAAFRKALEEGRDVLSISCSEALSASVKESIVAKERLSEQFPNAKIYCVDSHNCCYSLAMVVIGACKRRDKGESIEDVYRWIMEERQNFNEAGTVDKLIYLRNAGRVSASAAFFGGMLSVKPIVVYDETGHNVAVEKVRGRKSSLERVAEYVAKYIKAEKYPHVGIAHADCLEDAEELAGMIQGLISGIEITFHFGYVEPGVGSAVGPGTLIVGFYGDPSIRSLNA